MDGGAAVDAKNAPTAAWKTRRRVSHTAHRRTRYRRTNEETIPRLRAAPESDDTHTAYRVAGFQTFLSGRI